ncbi:MAG: hypothetical protein WB774_06230 [Xanthobacteraceae bacterium]
MVAAEREDRHDQLAFRGEGFVVDGVLGESGKLLESAMHGMGAGVEPCIMPPDRFADLFRVRGQFVPKAIEINRLAALDQALDIGPAKIEVPDFRIAQLVGPGSDPRQRRVDDDPACDPRRKFAAKA